MGNPILRAGAAAVVATASGTTLTATHPAGSQGGDVILIWNASPDPAITWSATGFTAVPAASGSTMSAQLLWKIDSGTEPGSYVVTSSASTSADLIIASYGNVNQVILFDPAVSSGILSSSTSTTINAGSITTLYPNTQLLWFGTVEDPPGGGSPVITQPGGYTVRVAQATGSSGGTNVAVLMADNIATSAGNTGTIAGTSSQNQFNGALLLGLTVAQPSGNLTPTRHQGPYRRRFGARLRRGQAFQPPMAQAQQGSSFPSVTRRSSRQPQWPKLLTRGRVFNGPIPQGTLSQPFPVFTRRSTKQRPGVLFIRRGRFFAPVPPQGAQGAQFPLFTRRPQIKRPGVLFIRRGRVFMPGLGQSAQGSPFLSGMRRRSGERTSYVAYRRVTRGRTFAPVPPQQPTGVQFPLFTRQASRPPLRRFATPRRRHHFFQYLIPRINWQAQAAFTGTGTLTASALVTELPSAHFSGTGTMTVTAVRTVPAAAALSGTGTMSAIAIVTKVASAALSGTGTLTAAGVVIRLAAAAFTGTGTLTATAQDLQAARLTGTGTMTVTPVLTISGAVAMSGTGTLSVAVTTTAAVQRITITPNAEAAWETISEGRLMDIREPHVAESYVTTQDLEDGTFDP